MTEEQPRNPSWPDDYDPYAILADPLAHPKHKAIAAINIDTAKTGAEWNKCMDCGYPYPLTEDADSYFCSDECRRAYTAAYNKEIGIGDW